MASDNPIATVSAQCQSHGPYKAKTWVLLNKKFTTPCPVCADERDKAERESEQRQQAAERSIRMTELLGSAQIPKRFTGKDFDGFHADSEGQRRALDTCREYADNFDTHKAAGRCLLLLGKTGTGKTHLAAAVANQLVRDDMRSVVYRTLGGLLHAIRASYDTQGTQGAPTEAKIMQACIGADLMIIDEIGATKATEFELATLFAIINGRYENLLPTLVLSNLDPKQLPQAMGDRCVDRLRENGGIAVIFDWHSRRAFRPQEAKQ